MDKPLLRKIAKRIKELRKQNHYTQDDLAYKSGIARSTLGNIETAKNDVVISKLGKIAEALNVSVSEFFNFT